MATTTKEGRRLRFELNEALLSSDDRIPIDRLPDVSLLNRRARRYARRQEQACSFAWASGDKWERDERRLEESIEKLALSLPGIQGVKFTGDPRGYTVRLILSSGKYNSWGGAEDGWGIA